MDIMSAKKASERWNISERWIQKLCEEGRIEGVQRFGRSLDDFPKGAEAC